MRANQSPQLLRSAAYFPVRDVAATADYYEKVLGFRRDYLAGSPPEFAIMSRDGLPLMLRRVPEPERICPNEKQGGSWDVFFWVRDVREVFKEMREAGAQVVYAPVMQEYGVEEMAIRDLDGHVLGFGEEPGSQSGTQRP